MSIFESSIIDIANPAIMESAGRSLASTLYDKELAITLSGELGAGKTTFARGFAKGLGIEEKVVSPTYALEQRYGETLAHIDLYRLNETQAKEFLSHIEEFPGIRLIEWIERLPSGLLKEKIAISIAEKNERERILTIGFRDVPSPAEDDIWKWMDEVRLPEHIRRHTKQVASVCCIVAADMKKRGTIVRTAALHSAALSHDLLRFVDFPDWDGDASYVPSAADKAAWQKCKNKYGDSHEEAAALFLADKGFDAIGEIARTHRGYDPEGRRDPKTTEQLILAYADKRVRFDEVVTLKERFDDFMQRYGKGAESEKAKAWRKRMTDIERMLFPEGPPL